MSLPPSLAGMTVVVTRPKHQATSFGALLEDLGARVVYMPLIAIEDPDSWAELDAALLRLADGAYDWIAFTSANAVESFFRRAANVPGGVRVAVVGPSTAAALEERGLTPDLIPATFTVEALAEALGRGPGRVLLPRVVGGPRVGHAFSAGGWTLDEVGAYRNARAGRASAQDLLEAGGFDAVTFLSPSAVDAFADAVAWDGLGLRNGEEPERTVACIGPRTAAAARRRGLRVDVEPEEHTARGLAEALARVPSGS